MEASCHREGEPMSSQVLIQVDEDDADPERVDAVARMLRAELLELDVDDVRAARDGAAPEGSRAFDVLAVGKLVVSIGSSKALWSVITAVRDWFTRNPDRGRSVKIEVDGDVLELTAATREDQERLVRIFLERHAPGTVP